MAIELPFEIPKDNPIYLNIQKFIITYQKLIDQSVPFTLRRWIGFGILLSLFLLRIFLTQGWYIICYALGIYLLNLFLAFLTPKFDPSLEQELKNESIEEGLDQEDPTTPVEDDDDDEFRPFIRRLPEFKFWYNAIRATIIALILTFFNIFDIPVFWPILLMYFIILFTLTMRRQIQHMIKYKYLPFDLGKTKYRST
ncbi:protein involved in retention of membrane proteins in the ER, putative [Candida dubliniensis CD36]|uniref:Protein RER1 n=1 Tax=Candida dubliniensis (strain CD36 / ATCC MYA-646 / CBS 7987 / NCPF 3949 / NRRL Y-17841) TaxID=573826 RepID=B9WJT7_CANDC|nr:protein involved in retention of membrane proteins in the ER, putative [Candida dubliniensis CD36]CAX40895.1 protein involved in retention of membrane proteins in the ER, putative [Candida dubliniensis CD36]